MPFLRQSPIRQRVAPIAASFADADAMLFAAVLGESVRKRGEVSINDSSEMRTVNALRIMSTGRTRLTHEA